MHNLPSFRGPTVSEGQFARWWSDRAITVSDIAKRLGITPQAVSARAKNRNLPQRRRGGRPMKIDDALFAEMWVFGVHTTDLMAHFNTGPCTIHKIARRLSLEPRGNTFRSALGVSDFRAHKARQLLEKAARETRAAMILSEMVDGVRPSQKIPA
jgi:hypothetical protein